MRIHKIILFVILFTIVHTPMVVRSETVPKVLILHSYHQPYHWTDDIMEGMMSVLQSADEEIIIYTEYLDAQRIPKETSWPVFERTLSTKYQGLHFDVILASDDDVLDFLLPRYKSLFPETPIVFCGINNLRENIFHKHKAFKGISQEIDAGKTIELALRLLPETENFLVISDRTSGGIKTTAKFKQDLEKLGPMTQKFNLLDDFTVQELKENLLALGPKDVVLTLRIQKIKGVETRDPVHFAKLITDTSPVPAFRVWGKGQEGYVGGVLVSAFAQGKAAAEYGLRIIAGEDLGSIPQVTRPPNVPTLNYLALTKYLINEKNIPEGTTITNKPLSLMDKYHRQVLLLIIIFVLLVCIITFLVIIIFLKQKNENILLQSNKSLAEAERNLNLLFNKSPIGICTVDALGNFITTNQAYENMLGYTKEELKGMSFLDITHPDYRPDNKKLFQEMFTLESSGFGFEKKYVRKDSAEIEVSINATAVHNEEGETLFETAFVEDVTERKRAERELIQSKVMNDCVVNGIVEPLFVKDTNHRWILVNDAFCRVMGKERDDLIGKSDFDFFSETEANIFWERDKKVLESGEADVSEETFTLDGKTSIFSTSKSSFDNPITGEKNIVGTIRDITDSKGVEEQLRQAQKMESVGRLAGGVAHDFNNMLSVIIGYSENALESLTEEDPLYDDLTEILNAGKRSADITRQLLAFSRQQTTAPIVLDLNECIEGMLKMLRRLIGEDIDLAWLPESNLSMIKIDPAQVDQILANLCVNARDAISDVGKIIIETKSIRISEDYVRNHPESVVGDFLMLAVSDNGSGMSAETVGKIFEPFFTTKGRFKGTGLGLSTVHGIVKQNQGFINVYSELNEGTTIKCYLPLQSGELCKEHLAEEGISALGGGETILLVEDDESILRLGVKILTKLGYNVIPISDPSEAAQIAPDKLAGINLLITDVVMPNMNGRELSTHLHSRNPRLKTLYMSGYTANVIAHRGVLDEGISFIQKPLSKTELSRKVREVLDKVDI